MDIKNIKRIIELMKENELCEFELEEENFRISIKRRNGSEPQVVLSHAATPVMMAAPPVAAPVSTAPVAPPAEAAPAKTEEANLVPVKSPIVGTFYRASSPDAEPYVAVGQEVDKETVVCIVEAMKVMNEIKAEVKGVIRKVLVENATPVQFGQPLFLVEPK